MKTRAPRGRAGERDKSSQVAGRIADHANCETHRSKRAPHADAHETSLHYQNRTEHGEKRGRQRLAKETDGAKKRKDRGLEGQVQAVGKLFATNVQRGDRTGSTEYEGRAVRKGLSRSSTMVKKRKDKGSKKRAGAEGQHDIDRNESGDGHIHRSEALV